MNKWFEVIDLALCKERAIEFSCAHTNTQVFFTCHTFGKYVDKIAVSS